MGNEDRGHVALPKLYGAPAYARPPVVATQPVERPFDPDELPLEAELTHEELEIVSRLPARPYYGSAPTEQLAAPRDGSSMLRGRPFRFLRLGDRPKGADRPGG